MMVDSSGVMEIIEGVKPMFLDRRQSADVREKGRADFVTQVDLRVQEYMRRRLKLAYPRIQFMGEEKDNSAIDFDGEVWILDPVDGTTNLIHDFRGSSLSLALWQDGKVTQAYVYHPWSGELFHARLGEGAWLSGRRLSVSGTEELEDALIGFGSSPYKKDYAKQNFAMFEKIFADCGDFRRIGSAAIELAFVAAGRMDAYLEASLQPWDYAAGMLLVREAGGEVTDFSGTPLSGITPSSLLCGTKPLVHTLAEGYVKPFEG